MRIDVVCERCGARCEVHRLGTRATVQFDHMCDDASSAAVHPPYAKGPIHAVDVAGGRPDPEPVF